MSKFTKVSLYFLSVLLIFAGCKKNDFDEYYARPAGLAEPIYQELQKRGNFTNLLKVIDRSGYKDILGKAGSWTLFAPNDAAFQKYLTDKGIANVDALTEEQCRGIAIYGLVYNPFRKDQLTSTQSAGTIIPNTSFRRQSAYYDFVYTQNGMKIVDNGANTNVYTESNNNNKYIPYFISSFLDYNLLNGVNGTPDYDQLYPGTSFSGFSVAGAQVVNADIPAENGMIHEIDKVIEPLQSLDQYIASNPDYSEFKKLLDKVALYSPNDAVTKRYKTLTGSNDQVYVKSYTGLPFSPNNENTSIGGLPAQSTAWSMVVPTNDQLKAYTDDVLQYYNGSFDAAPSSVLTTFLSSCMWINTLWPSTATTDMNALFESATFDASDLVEKKVLSNGMFYGTKKVQEPNAFRTVYGQAYLNPDYSLMTQAINGSDLSASAKTPPSPSGEFKYTVFMISDDAMGANGLSYDPNLPGWGYTAPGAAIDQTAAATTRVNRVVQTAFVKTPYDEFDVLTGEGVGEAFNGEYVKFKGGKVQASGNVIDNTFYVPTSNKAALNGRAYFSSDNTILKFAEDAVTLAASIEKLGTSTDVNVSSKFSHFWNFLKNNASIYNATTKEITGVDKGSFYTVFIPTNAAIEAAVKAGRLPGNTVTGAPNFTYTTWNATQSAAVTRFIQYAIVSKNTLAVDGKKAGSYQTILKNEADESRIVTVSYDTAPSAWNNTVPLKLTDDAATGSVTATSIYSSSNNLANRALIHSINTVLKF
jgi:uncharacterized surface protein with fasciclin (FAS1) repeats